ncbi:MAG: ABC transporter permease [SAR324 cluster bacterium]|nr:ABC transporter permease [SAR324 cluster bacterium]
MNTAAVVFSPRRVAAMVLRYLYLMRSSWPRVIEMIYWPTVQVILWGFISKFFATNSWWVAQAAGVLLSAVLLWDIMYRSQLGVSLMFFEEMYSRNLGHLFVSPLRVYELVAALLTMSFLRTLISFVGASLLAIPLYSFSIYDLGFPLLIFFFNLIVTGWAVGLMVASLVMRYGLGAESLAWVAIFAISPLTGIYYPVSVLPEWLQYVSNSIPSTHVFEGMRAVMIDHTFRFDLLSNALLLNAVYMAVGILLFVQAFQAARRNGLLLQIGE